MNSINYKKKYRPLSFSENDLDGMSDSLIDSNKNNISDIIINNDNNNTICIKPSDNKTKYGNYIFKRLLLFLTHISLISLFEIIFFFNIISKYENVAFFNLMNDFTKPFIDK